MKIRSFLIASCFFLMNSFSGNAQSNFCASDEVLKTVQMQHPEVIQVQEQLEEFTEAYRQNTANKMQTTQQSQVFIVPVVFHIIHQYGPENISDAQILDAVNILNRDFRKLNPDTSQIVAAFQGIAADCEIEFRLARKDPNGNCTTGIDRIASSETFVGDEGSKLNPWPKEKYLNIWVCSVITTYDANGNPIHTAAAYAYYPGTAPNGKDGVITLSNYVGSIGTSSVNTSRTLGHEVGHYLNLQHTWGNTNSPGVACGDDHVGDTPDTKGWGNCNLTSNAVCTPSQPENVQNYMEYAYCSKMFTQGQRTRMRAALNSTTAGRNNLWSTSNLAATGTDGNFTAICPPIADFTSNIKTFCSGGSVNFSWLSSGGHPTTWSWSFPGGTPATSTDSFPTVSYSAAGTYSVSLTVTNGSGTDAITKSGFIIVYPSVATYSAWQWVESFESGSIPNADWTVLNTDSNATWTVSNAAAFSGSSCIKIVNSTSIMGQTDEAIGPGVKMAAINVPILYFRVAFAQHTVSNQDRLQVYISINCGQTWSLRYNKAGGNLKTVAPATSPFVPSGPADWRRETVTIPYPTAQNLMTKFVFISDGGNDIYVDDINITGTATGVNELNDLETVNIYPNPMNGSSTLSFDLQTKANVKIDMFDVLGRNVNTMVNAALAEGEHQYTINKGSLDAGIYFVKMTVDGRSVTKKLIIQ